MKEYIVLVTVDNYNSLGIVRTLGESGIRPIVISISGPRNKVKMASASRYVKKSYFINSFEESLDLLLSLSNKCNEKSFILTNSDDVSVFLDKNRNLLKDRYYFANAGDNEELTKLQDKDYQIQLAKRAGFNIIPSWKVRVGDIPKNLEYPIITKASNTYGKEWKDIVYICNTEDELLDVYKKINSEFVVLQKYIQKVTENSYDGFSINKGKEVFWAFQNTEKYHQEGRYYPYWISTNVVDENIKECANEFLRLSGYEGIFEFEFVVDESDKRYFLEMNLRNTVIGWTSTIVGMPLVTNWCVAMENGEIDPGWHKVISKPIESIAECYDYDLRVRTHQIGKLNWLKEYFKAESKLYKGRRDFIPFFNFMWYKITKMRREK